MDSPANRRDQRDDDDDERNQRNRCERDHGKRDRFRRARTALEHASIVPEWGRVIRRLTDWIVLDGGHPMEDFDLGGARLLRGVNEEKACKAMLLVQGLGALCQHFGGR